MKKAAVYARVSSSEQANKDTSIPTQLSMLKSYAKENDMKIVREYIDAGFSAYKDAESRKQFMEMIVDAKESPKPFDVILYCYNDRVFRNMDDAVAYRSLLRKKRNIELICITQPFDTDTAHGQFMERVFDAIAEWDSATKGERIKAVMTNQSKKGVALSEPPYGYMIDKKTGKYAIYEPEAKVVRYIYDEYINGGSLRSIMIDLRTNGKNMFGEAVVKKISKAIGNEGKHKDHDVSWKANSVRRKLTNRAYIGEYNWNGEIIKNNHPAIVSEEKYELANIILSNKTTTRRGSMDYLLKDIVYCYECKGPISQLTRRYKIKAGEKRIARSLRCSDHVRKGICYSNFNKMSKIDNELTESLERIKKGEVSLEDIEIDKSTNPLFEKIDKLQKKLEGFDSQFDRQMEAYQAGVIDLEQLKKYKENLKKEKENIAEKIEKMKNDIEDEELQRNILHSRIEKTIRILDDPETPLQSKKNALQLLIKRVEISRDKDLMRIVFKY